MLINSIKRMFAPISQQSTQASLARKTWHSQSLNQYLNTALPSLQAPLSQLEFIAIDFETTGLCPQGDKVLSIGTVQLTLDDIELSTSSETFVNHAQYIKAETAQVNEITPNQLNGSIDAPQAFERLIDIIRGKVVIAHHASIERSFIEEHFKLQYGLPTLPCYFIDTLNIEKKFSFHGKKKLHTSYQLDDLRQHYRLPAYLSHSAASDALACGELFTVQCKKLQLQHHTLESIL